MNNAITNIVIVGRSNVGKSTLYNRLLGRKEAITGEDYGLTRDYQAGRCILNDIEVMNGSSLDALNTMKLVYKIYHADPLWRDTYDIKDPDA